MYRQYLLTKVTWKLTYFSVTAEKVFLIGNKSKRNQLFRELESLKTSSVATDNSYIVKLLEVYSNHIDGSLSLCLEYMDWGKNHSVAYS